MLLALDTATTVLSVALVHGDGDSVEVVTTDGPGDRAVAVIADLLADQAVSRGELTSIGVGVGPGPYTSTRIGVMVAITIGAALGIPVFGICSLDAIARQALSGDPGLRQRDVTGPVAG
ncbi:MAG: tRNA (adenosine(37)-N6)-threonylcarbamoyltransferase complex dimerization subunit type 1 TsaB [Actinomycetes bacterium]